MYKLLLNKLKPIKYKTLMIVNKKYKMLSIFILSILSIMIIYWLYNLNNTLIINYISIHEEITRGFSDFVLEDYINVEDNVEDDEDLKKEEDLKTEEDLQKEADLKKEEYLKKEAKRNKFLNDKRYTFNNNIEKIKKYMEIIKRNKKLNDKLYTFNIERIKKYIKIIKQRKGSYIWTIYVNLMKNIFKK